MTVRIIVTQTCDRCERPIAEDRLEYGEEIPVIPRATVRLIEDSLNGGEPKTFFAFTELCERCQSAVDNLIAKIRLDSSAKGKKQEEETEKDEQTDVEEEEAPLDNMDAEDPFEELEQQEEEQEQQEDEAQDQNEAQDHEF